MRLIPMVMASLVSMTAAMSAVAQQETPNPLTPESVPTTVPEDLAPASSTPTLTEADASAWLDGYVPYALARGDVAGAVVVVVKDGQVLVKKGYGYADVEQRTPVDPDRTLFRPGSVSKLLTWTAVMQQVEQGKLDLDTDINTYLDFKVPSKGQPITLRHVLTHTPGLEERVRSLITPDPDGVQPLGEYLKSWVPRQIFAPGTTPAYSNYATSLAGYIVERVSGMSFDDYVDQHIFAPLGMEYASFRQPLPERLKPLASQGYALASQPAKPYEMVTSAPAGSLAASGTDMARFMIAHLQDGAFGDQRILSAETARQMHQTQTNHTPPLNAMALGFYETNINGRRVIAHGGDTQWFHSYLHLFMDDGVGLFISMNSAGREGVTGVIRDSLFQQFANRYLPARDDQADATVDAETAKRHAQAISGLYRSSRRSESNPLALLNLSQIKVYANDDGTISTPMLKGTGGQILRWKEVSPLVWQEVGGTMRLAAVEENGKIVRWGFDAFSPFMVLEPVPASKSAAWLMPALVIGLVVLVLTVLAWPLAAIVRRRYGHRLVLEGRQRRAFRVSRLAALAVTLVMLAWLGAVGYGMSDLGHLDGAMGTVFLLLSVLSLVAFVGGAAALLWNAWVVWTGDRGWWAKVWSLLLALASLVVLWVALSFGLLSFTAQF